MKGVDADYSRGLAFFRAVAVTYRTSTICDIDDRSWTCSWAGFGSVRHAERGTSINSCVNVELLRDTRKNRTVKNLKKKS